MDGRTVLIVDDDLLVATVAGRELHGAGLEVHHAADGAAGLRAFWDVRPDVVVLDVVMPVLDGWAVLERIREVSDVGVVMLTTRDSELEQVRGLRAGADAYVPKPFSPPELVARVQALLRRLPSSGESITEHHRDALLTIDHRARAVSVTASGAPVALTPLEMRLLSVFTRHPGQVLAREQVLAMVWRDAAVDPAQVKLLVARLRSKLAPVGAQHAIATVRGFGYRYDPLPDGG